LHAIVNTEDISIPHTETVLNIETLSIAPRLRNNFMKRGGVFQY